MEFDIITLIFVMSLTVCTQVVALFIQFKLNNAYRGIGYWLLGSSLMALGYVLMPMVTVKHREVIAVIANPLLIAGHIFFYIGIKRFLDRKLNKWLPISFFIVFNLFYYYYLYLQNEISARTVIISVAIAIISFIIAFELFFNNGRFVSGATNFTATVFLLYGGYFIVRTIQIIMVPSMDTYNDERSILVVGFLVSIVTSNLWTFGLIIMVNQRLNMDNIVEKEKLQMIFNTNLDAQLITRLDNGLIVDVNDEFSILTGFLKAEVIGKSTQERSFWTKASDRKVFTTELNKNKICENMEFVFQRKDKTQFAGMISARIINIHSITHIISVVRDISERKWNELQMQKLIQQLEIEKNTAQLNSITDSLTGLANRRYFDEIFSVEFFRLKRSKSKLSLIMLDIDYFKKFNDSYGHLAGDHCIQMIATTLKTIIGRAPDIAARYGGEEFIAILPETDENGAKIMGERIRKTIEELTIPHSASEISEYVTVSVGMSTVYPVDLVSPEQVLKLVDEALYSAKAKGRNCCVYSA